MFCHLASRQPFNFSFFPQKICFKCFCHREYGTAGAGAAVGGGFKDCYSAHISGRHIPSPQISPEKSAE